jgi:hypothetical protein
VRSRPLGPGGPRKVAATYAYRCPVTSRLGEMGGVYSLAQPPRSRSELRHRANLLGVLKSLRASLARPRPRWWAFCGYFLATALLTFPAWFNPTTKWIGAPGDPMKFMEFLGWYPFAISHGLNPLLNRYVNLPSGSNMMWDTTMPLAAVCLWPVTALFGVIAAWNVGVVGALVLDGWCTFLWLRRHVRHAAAAWTGGLMMVLGPFAVARVHGHLNLLFFFPMPLLFIEIEKFVESRGRRPLASGALVGLLVAVELLCCEEIVALGAIAVGTVLVIGLLMDRHVLTNLWAALAKAGASAAVVFFVLTAVPLAYQFLGPGRITGPLQPLNYYVTDIVNVVVPNAYTALDPHFALSLSERWPRYTIENDAYIGLPLIVMAVFTVARWWRERWVRLIGLGTIAALVWSLGPFLHFNGGSEKAIGFPGAVLVLLPVADNILPARFDLFTDFGLGALIAVFVDRVVLAGSWRARAAGGTAMLLVCVTLAPKAPIAAYSPGTPRYFAADGDVRSLRQGSIALVVPYGDGEATMAPMLWQTVSGFRFRMVAGAMFTAGPRGAPAFGGYAGGTSLDCVMGNLQLGLPPGACTADPVEAARAELDKLRVSVIIMGPLAYGTDPALTRQMEQFLDAVAGAPPRYDESVLLWEYP